MTANAATIDLIKEFEGFRSSTYKDAAGVLTIGYGTTAAASVGIIPAHGMTITEPEAAEYLHRAVDKFADQIKIAITQPCNENEFGAFVSLAYNIGPGAFRKSSVLRHFNNGDKAKAAASFEMWNKAGGKVLAGLVRRRKAEKALFLRPAVRLDGTTPRKSPVQSTTLQASAVQIASGAGAGIAAIGGLSGAAQVVALVFAGVIVLAALWIAKERLRKWVSGDR